MNFMKGIVILTVLLMSVTISFFMGRIIGSELMDSGREQLETYTESAEDTDPGHPALAGPTFQADIYDGPTSNRFPQSYTEEPVDDGNSGSVILIDPVDDSSSGSAGIQNPFTLDPTSENTSGKKYRIQLGVFEGKDNADNLVADLIKENYPAYAAEDKSDPDNIRWKVYVGPFPTREAANAVADQLRAGNYEAFVQ